MKRIALTFILGSFVSLLWGQSSITLSGKVVNKASNEPLGFSTINVPNTSIGVVANQVGEFELKIPAKFTNDSLHVSSLGFQTIKLTIEDARNNDFFVVKMEASIIQLPEVTVSTKELTALDILKTAMKSIKDNHPSEKFGFEAFYREYKIENEKCVGLFEAAFSVYDKGYKKPANNRLLQEKVVLKNVRKSITADFESHPFKRVNTMAELLGLNDVRYRSRALERLPKIYTYSIDGYEMIGNRLTYKIKAVEDWSFIYYVDVETYAFLKVDMDYEWEEGVAENKWTLGDTVRYEQHWAKEILDFHQINGKWYPKYHSFHFFSKAFDERSGELLHTHELMQEYLVNEIILSDLEKPQKDERLKDFVMIEQQATDYDPEFWEDYNITKLNPIQDKLLRELKERQLLGEQFSNKQ